MGNNKGSFDHILVFYKEFCQREYQISIDCISNDLNRARAHLCMDRALDEQFIEKSTDEEFCEELEWAWKCSWKLIDDRCGEDVNHYIDQLHNISLRQLE